MHNTFKYITEANTFQHIHMFIIIHKTNTIAEIKYTENNYLENKMSRN